MRLPSPTCSLRAYRRKVASAVMAVSGWMRRRRHVCRDAKRIGISLGATAPGSGRKSSESAGAAGGKPLLRRRQESLALSLLAGELPGAAECLALLAGTGLGR